MLFMAHQRSVLHVRPEVVGHTGYVDGCVVELDEYVCGNNVLILDPDVLVSVRSLVFVDQTKCMADLMGNDSLKIHHIQAGLNSEVW